MDHSQRDPRRLSAMYQYHNAPEVAPAHGLEYDDTIHSASSDKYPVIQARHYDPAYVGKAYDHDRPPRIIFGMKVRTFCIVAVVMVVLVVGAAVGGAVGGRNMRENHEQEGSSLVNANEQDSSSSATPPGTLSSSVMSTSSSTYSASTPTYTPLNPCPAANDTMYTSTLANQTDISAPSTAGLDFTRYCDMRSPLEGTANVSILSQAFVYSFDDCIEICAALNFWANDKNCTVAVYDASGSRPENCLAGRTGGVDVAGSQEELGIAVAILST